MTIYKGMNINQLMEESKKYILTDIDSIIDMQDVIGHTSQGDLIRAAKKDRFTFMRIISNCWGIEEQLRFYDNFVSPQIDIMNKKIQEKNEEISALKYQLYDIKLTFKKLIQLVGE